MYFKCHDRHWPLTETNILLTFGFIFLQQKVQKEPIPEEQEMDFQPVEEGEECSDSDSNHNAEAKEPEKTNKKEGERADRAGVGKAQFWNLLPFFFHQTRSFLSC